MMFRVVLVQVLATLLVAAIAAMVSGGRAALSALFGGLACAVPNGMFALNLALLGRFRGTSGDREGAVASASALAILIGELCKVALTIGLLALLVWGYKEVLWLALIISVGAVLLVQPLALAWPTNRQARN